MKTLEFSRKAEIEQLDDEALWAISTPYNLDTERLTNWLKDQAHRYVLANKNQFTSIATIRFTSEEIYKRLKDHVEGIISHVGNVPHYNDIKDGHLKLKEKSPTQEAIAFCYFGKILSCIIEFGVFTYLFAFAGGGWVLPLLAIALALGSIIFGVGKSNLMLVHEKNIYEEEKSQPKTRDKALMLLGLTVVVLVIALRFYKGGVLAGLLAVIFSLLIAGFETFHRFLSEMRSYFIEMQWQAGKKNSYLNLSVDLNDKALKNFIAHIKSYLLEYKVFNKSYGGGSEQNPNDQTENVVQFKEA